MNVTTSPVAVQERTGMPSLQANGDSGRYAVDRPRSVTAICLVGFALSAISALFTLIAVAVSGFSASTSILLIASLVFFGADAVCRIGMWKMRVWSVWGYAALQAVLVLAVAIQGNFSPTHLMLPIITLKVLWSAYDDMD